MRWTLAWLLSAALAWPVAAEPAKAADAVPSSGYLPARPGPADGALIYSQGARLPGDAGAGWFRWDAASTEPGVFGIVVAAGPGPGRWVRQFTGAVHPFWTGAFCDGNARGDADSDALQAAWDYAARHGLGLHVDGTGRGCMLSRPLVVTGAPTITGDGPAVSILTGLFDGPTIDWVTADGAQHNKFLFADFTLRGQAPAGSTRQRGLLIEGDDQVLSHGRIHGLVAEGVYAFAEIAKASTPGHESPFAWTGWTDNVLLGTTYGWIFRHGSGTGNTFEGTKTVMAPGGAVFRFEGAGQAVGDVITQGGHYGAARPGGVFLSVAAGTFYRGNIAIDTSQFDANMDVPLSLAGGGTPYSHLTFTGNNAGGAMQLGATLPNTIERSTIDDGDTSRWSAGGVKATDALGPQTVPLFVLDLADSYSGTRCDVIVSGLVGGRAGGSVEDKWAFGRRGAVAVAAARQAHLDDTGGALAVVVTPVAGPDGAPTTQALISAALSPTATGSHVEGQITCRAGRFRLVRR